MKYLILLAGAVLLFFSLTKKPMPQYNTPLSHADTILAVGDSLTNGFGALPEESYPAILSRMLGKQIINTGRNGETSEEGLQRLPALLERYHPALTILCYGGNDILQKKSMAALKQNLKEMITMIKNTGSDVLLIAVPNITLFGLEPLPLYEEVAKEEQVPLIKGLLADILDHPSLKSDYIHPNAKGYRKMAEAVYEKIKEEGWIE